MSAIKDYEVICHYHSDDYCSYKIMASTPEDAEEIARIKFRREHTLKCFLDDVKVKL